MTGARPVDLSLEIVNRLNVFSIILPKIAVSRSNVMFKTTAIVPIFIVQMQYTHRYDMPASMID